MRTKLQTNTVSTCVIGNRPEGDCSLKIWLEPFRDIFILYHERKVFYKRVLCVQPRYRMGEQSFDLMVFFLEKGYIQFELGNR